MLETNDPVEVITTLRTAQQFLREEAERLRARAVSQADYGNWGPTERSRTMLDTADDLGALADQIAAEAEAP